MRGSPSRGASLGVLLVTMGVAIAARAAGPCEQIAAVCESAGFVRGGAGAGNGLVLDCIDPIMRGSAPPRRASISLPEISAEVVAACKAQEPGCGQGAVPPALADGQAAHAVPAAAAAPMQGPTPTATTGRRPNIVFILTDDLTWNL